MGAVLFVVFMVVFAMVAPVKVLGITVAGVGFASMVVQAAANTISGIRVSLAQAFRTLLLSCLFSMVAGFTLMSFMWGAPRFLLNDFTGAGAMVFQYGAGILAFRMGLGLTWLHAALVALASSAILGVCITLVARLMH